MSDLNKIVTYLKGINEKLKSGELENDDMYDMLFKLPEFYYTLLNFPALKAKDKDIIACCEKAIPLILANMHRQTPDFQPVTDKNFGKH